MTLATRMRTGTAGCALVLLLAGCTGGAPRPATASTLPPSSPPPDPLTVCVNQLTHWADQELAGAPDQGYDHQHRGLTSAQADALRDIVGQAQALGSDRPSGFVAERVQVACRAVVGAGSPG